MSGSSVERSKPRIGYGLCRLAAVRRGSIVRITIYGVLAGILASLVAVLVPWLPTSASEQMDRIEFTFWFTTVICIAVFSVVAAVILYSILNFRVPLDDELDGPPIHGHTGLEIVWTAVPGDPRDRDLDRQRHRAGEERQRRPEPDQDRGHRATVLLAVRISRRGEVHLRPARPAGERDGQADTALPRRDPLVLGSGIWAEVGCGARNRDDTRDHAEPDGRVLYRLYGAVRARPRDDALGRSRRRPRPVREVRLRSGNRGRGSGDVRARRFSRPPAAAPATRSSLPGPTPKSART